MVDSKQDVETVEVDSHDYKHDKYTIAIDLDGTLAQYDGWKGIHHIGEPIPQMVVKMKDAFDSGKEIYIFSARFDTDTAITFAVQWAEQHDLAHMISGFTNVKMKIFKEIWDDRAKQVIPNNGQFLEETPSEIDMPEINTETICKAVGLTENALRVAQVMSMNQFTQQVGGSHYKSMVIQPGIYCEMNGMDSIEANIVKYVSRHENKNGLQDIEKVIEQAKMIAAIKYGVQL